MGNSTSRTAADGAASDAPAFTGKLGALPRVQAITEGGRKGRSSVKLPPKATRSSPEEWPFIEVRSFSLVHPHPQTGIDAVRASRLGPAHTSLNTMTHAELCAYPCPQSCLAKLLLFGKLDFSGQRRIAADMYERNVLAGEILIKEGDTGITSPTYQHRL